MTEETERTSQGRIDAMIVITCDTRPARRALARLTYVSARLGGLRPMEALALAYGPRPISGGRREVPRG